jgi:chromosome partitioning protein
MQIIALISQKGGVGKTTLCIHLATAFVADGYNTLLLDLDPQASAAEWKDARESEEPAVLAVPPSRLPKVIEEARKIGTDIMIIDTAPHSEGTALDAARVADVVLVPCQPSIMDIRAMRKTVDLLSHVKKPIYAILNGVAPHGSVADEAAKAITIQFKLKTSPVRIGERVAYNRCLITGQAAQEFEPGGKASQEIMEFYKWARNLVNISSSKKEKVVA